MKFLIAFALVSVAFADEIRVAPVTLPRAPSPIYSPVSMGQVIIPNYIIEAAREAKPVMRHEAFEDDGLKVHFVDAPVEVVDSVIVVDSPYVPVPESESVIAVETPENIAPVPVTLGKAPEPAFETADTFKVQPIKIAEPRMPEFVIPEPVQFAEAPMPAFETKVDAVRIADAPIEANGPQPVMLPEAPLPAYETADAVEVQPIKIAEPRMPEFVIPEPVQIAEAPMPAFETKVDAVRFADFPIEANGPQPVMLPEAPLPAFETVPAVEPVKIGVPQFRDYRVKQFDDPMMR